MRLVLHKDPWSIRLDPEGVDVLAIRNLLKGSGGTFEQRHWHFPVHPAYIDRLIIKLRDATGRAPDMDIEAAQSCLLLDRIIPDLITPMNWECEPYPHQVTGVWWLSRLRGGVLADDMGLGKTLQAIQSCRNINAQSVIVICPASVMGNWKEEIERFDPGAYVCMMNGTPGERKLALNNFGSVMMCRKYLVVNYDKVRISTKGKQKDEATEIIRLARGAVVICDEAHRLKNGKAMQSMAVRSMAPERIWLLTGTPVANKPEDVWHLCRLVCPGLLGWYWSHFEERYIERDFRGAIARYKNPEKIAEAFATVSMGRKKEQVVDLPEKLYVRRDVELSPEERRAYKAMLDDMITFLADFRSGEITAVAAAGFAQRFLRLRQIASGYVSSEPGVGAWVAHPSKILASIEAWEDAGRPRAIFWCFFREVMNETERRLRAAPLVLQIHGGVKPEDRQGLVQRWSRTEGAVLLGQINTAGEGLNLQAGSWQVFIDPALTPRERLQAIDRQHRIGQENHVTVVDVLAKNTVDMQIWRRLKQKMEDADEITAGVYRQFMREMIEEIA